MEVVYTYVGTVYEGAYKQVDTETVAGYGGGEEGCRLGEEFCEMFGWDVGEGGVFRASI